MDQDLMYGRREREKVPTVHPITWPHRMPSDTRKVPGLRVECSWSRRGALKVTLEGVGQPLVVELEPRAMRAARRSRRDSAGRWAPNSPCQNPLAVGRRGRPSRFARPWAGPGAQRVRTRRGRQGVGPGEGGRGFPLSGDLRGAEEPGAGTAPLLGPSRGAGLSLGPWGAVGVGLSRAAGARAPWSRTARKRRPCRLGLQSSPAPPPSRSGSSFSLPPPPRRGSASALLPLALRVALPGFQGGCPGRAARRRGAGKGEESRPPA